MTVNVRSFFMVNLLCTVGNGRASPEESVYVLFPTRNLGSR